jgi:hypothetical protein
MKKWFVEKGVFEENEEKLSLILGDRLTFVKRDEGQFGVLDMEGNVVTERGIFYGSIAFGRYLQTQGFFSFLPDNVFDCNYWMHHFGPLALNDEHMYIEAGCFKTVVKALGIEKLGFFVKQNKGYKFFSGQVYNGVALADIESQMFPEDLVLIAPKKEIGREFRFVIATDFKSYDYEIVTYSRYGLEENLDPTVPQSVIDYADQCIKGINYAPCVVWTLDICELYHEGSEKYAVVEPNSLMTSGWYNCDIQKIVDVVDRLLGE